MDGSGSISSSSHLATYASRNRRMVLLCGAVRAWEGAVDANNGGRAADGREVSGCNEGVCGRKEGDARCVETSGGGATLC